MERGSLILTNSVEARNEITAPALRMTWKAKKGTSFLMLNFGTISSKDEANPLVSQVLGSLGWVAVNDRAGLENALAVLAGLAALEQE